MDKVTALFELERRVGSPHARALLDHAQMWGEAVGYLVTVRASWLPGEARTAFTLAAN